MANRRNTLLTNSLYNASCEKDFHLTSSLLTTLEERTELPPPRLVERDLTFHQSRNRFNLEIKDFEKNAAMLRRHDWFHAMLREETWKSLLVLLFSWTAAILIFASLYMALDLTHAGTPCSLQNPNIAGPPVANYGSYFAFSLETTTTVGYGLPNGTNGFFEQCSALQTTIYFQILWSMMFNAFLFAFVFSRLAKVENRGSQVIFSNTAVLARTVEEDDPYQGRNSSGGGVGGPWTFSVRVADVDAAYPVVEAHVRVYAKVGGQMIELRILSPNDVLRGTLLLSWPTTIKHEIDHHSPFYPPPLAGLSSSATARASSFLLPNSGLNGRNAEAMSGENDQYACPACGEAYGDIRRLRNHVAYLQRTETNDGLPIGPHTHRALSLEEFQPPPVPTLEEMKKWFPDEVIVIVEGIDSLASGTFQALQSYTLDDISFEGQYDDCIKFTKTGTVVDLNKFHSVVPQRPANEFDNTANVRTRQNSRMNLFFMDDPSMGNPGSSLSVSRTSRLTSIPQQRYSSDEHVSDDNDKCSNDTVPKRGDTTLANPVKSALNRTPTTKNNKDDDDHDGTAKNNE